MTESTDKENAQEGQLNGATVVVADDDPSIIESISDFVSSRGYAMRSADSAEKAIDLCTRLRSLQLAIFDNRFLQLKSGIDAALELKANRPGCPIFVMSGYPVPMQQRDQLVGRGIALLEKPVDPRILENILAEAHQEGITSKENLGLRSHSSGHCSPLVNLSPWLDPWQGFSSNTPSLGLTPFQELFADLSYSWRRLIEWTSMLRPTFVLAVILSFAIFAGGFVVAFTGEGRFASFGRLATIVGFLLLCEGFVSLQAGSRMHKDKKDHE